MKEIHIFIASSIDEFEKERDKFEIFIHNIGRKTRQKYGIDIIPLRCENCDPYFRKGRSQDEFNELIKNSEMCFFLFYTKAGDYTVEEFKVACETFKKYNKPKIYTYFKTIQNGEEINESLTRFIGELSGTYNHFYQEFSNIDTVKLRFLLSLKLQEMDFLKVELEDGKCYVDGKEAVDLDIANVSEFANNKELEKWNREYEKVNSEYLRLKPLAEKQDADYETIRKYSEVASKRQNLLDTINELQKNIFNVSMRMCKDDIRGEITQRQAEAYRLFEQGDVFAALAVLDESDIDSEYERTEKLLDDEIKSNAAVYIREHKTAINFLMTLNSYPERFKDIERKYEKITKAAQKHLVEINVLYDYAHYLHEQNKSEPAYECAKKLENIYDANPDMCTDSDRARLYNLFGLMLYHIPDKLKESEEYNLKAIEIRKKLVKNNPQAYEIYLANSYISIGNLYYYQRKYELAKENYLKAIEIDERLVTVNPKEYQSNLAVSYTNVGIIYKIQGNTRLAEESYKKAFEIQKQLAKANPDRFEPDLADTYNNIGSLYYRQGNIKLAEENHLKAIEIRERLVKTNPDRFEPDLAKSYNSMGVSYYMKADFEMSEENYLKAMEIRKRLAKTNPDRFEADLAESYSNIGILYHKQGRIELAEENYLKAIEIRERLAKTNPDRFEPDLADTYTNIGSLYHKQGNIKLAEENHLKAMEIRERLVKTNPDRFEPDLADCYYRLGLLSKNNHYIDKAKTLAEKHPDNPLCKKIIS